MTRYKGWPAWGKWLDTKQNFPASSGTFQGLIQGPPLRVGGGPPELMAQRGETLVLPDKGSGSKGGKEGGAILVPHPPFPTQEGGGCGSWDFPEQQKILGN